MKIKRCEDNPILTPGGEIGAVFNPGVAYDGKIHLLPRVVPKGNGYISYIGHTTSEDGLHFPGLIEPFIIPDSPLDYKGCEDARVIKLNGEYLITYTGLSEKGARPILASTKDFSSVEKYGIIGPDRNNKDCVIFPELINGKIAVLLRIYPDIQIAYFDDIKQLKQQDDKFWKNYLKEIDQHILLSKKYSWEEDKIGAGPPPIKTKEGWLLVYHGMNKNKIYRAGAVLLDLKDPSKIIARTKQPILEPKKNYELFGDVSNVVFPEGMVVIDKKLYIYYGAADKTICLATCNLNDLVDLLLEDKHKTN